MSYLSRLLEFSFWPAPPQSPLGRADLGIDCKPPAQANRTPELAQIIRSNATWRLTLLFCDCHCRTASGASSSAPLGAAHLSKPSRGRFIPIYIVRNLQKLF